MVNIWRIIVTNENMISPTCHTSRQKFAIAISWHHLRYLHWFVRSHLAAILKRTKGVMINCQPTIYCEIKKKSCFIFAKYFSLMTGRRQFRPTITFVKFLCGNVTRIAISNSHCVFWWFNYIINGKVNSLFSIMF